MVADKVADPTHGSTISALFSEADPDPAPDPHYSEKLDPDPHKSQNSESSEAQNRAVDAHHGGLEALRMEP
jgi:hypothetical protein